MNNVVYLSNPKNPSYVFTSNSLAYRAIILNIDVSSELTRLYGNGSTFRQIDFGFNFALDCAKYVVEAFNNLKDPENHIEEIIRKFAYAVSLLSGIEYARSIYELHQYLHKSLTYLYYSNMENFTYNLNHKIVKILHESVKNNIIKKNAISNIFKVFYV